MLSIGIIGAGSIVRERHMPGLAALAGVRVAAVANSTLASALEFCRRFAPSAAALGDWRELIARQDLDIIWIGAGPFLHAPASIASLESGRHVFCQARMATDLESAIRMLASAEARPDLVTMLCPPPHGLGIDAFARERIAALGNIHAVRLRSLSGAYLDPTRPPHWRQRTEVSGKNILTLGIYAELLQRWLGGFRVLSARSELLTPVRNGYAISIPDAISLLASFDNGAEGVLEFSGISPDPAVESLEISGEGGLLRFDFQKDTVESCGRLGGGFVPLDIPETLVRPWRVEADFVHAVTHPDAPRPHPDFRDGVAYMRVVEDVWNLLEAPAG